VHTVATDSGPGSKEVEAWLEAVRGDLRRVAAGIEPLLAEQSRLRDREALLTKLLQSLTTNSAGAETPGAQQSTAAPPPRVEGSVLDYVRTCVVEVLREKGGGPMHINDIHARFLVRGFRIPGAGRPANLTAHLGRCPGIVSPSRGFYAIGDDEGPAPRRRRRKRR
jgi:hypothetical protein